MRSRSALRRGPHARPDRSPVDSTFGYYVGGQKDTSLSAALSIFF